MQPAFLFLPQIIGKLNIRSLIQQLFLLLLDSERWHKNFNSFKHA